MKSPLFEAPRVDAPPIGSTPSPGSTRCLKLNPKGSPRFFLYSVVQLLALFVPPLWYALPLALFIALSAVSGYALRPLLRRVPAVLFVAGLPMALSFPFGTADGFWAAWLPGIEKSLGTVYLFVLGFWLADGMSPSSMSDTIALLLRPLGERPAHGISRACSLTLAFLPWTADEIAKAGDAARLRGSDPAKRPVRHMKALVVPLSLRTLDKAKRGSEALSLRDGAFAKGTTPS